MGIYPTVISNQTRVSEPFCFFWRSILQNTEISNQLWRNQRERFESQIYRPHLDPLSGPSQIPQFTLTRLSHQLFMMWNIFFHASSHNRRQLSVDLLIHWPLSYTTGCTHSEASLFRLCHSEQNLKINSSKAVLGMRKCSLSNSDNGSHKKKSV